MDVNTFSLIIATSANFTDYNLFRDRLDFLLQNREYVELCIGFSKAGDEMADQYAADRSHILKPFDPGFRGMYRAIAYAQAAVFFHDGVSGGISKYIEEAQRNRLRVKVVLFKPAAKDIAITNIPPKSFHSDVQPITHPDQITTGKPRKRGNIVIEGEELVPDTKPKTKKAARTSQTVYRYDYKKLYHEAHEQWFQKEYPHAWKDGFYTPKTKVPDVNTANGMASYIIDHAGWTGNYANRINVMGRQVGGFTKTRSGKTFDDRKFIKSSTKRGTPDLDLLINGTSIKPEIKINSDTESDKQQEQAAKIKRAGGVAVVFRSIDDYFDVFYRYSVKQTDLFSP